MKGSPVRVRASACDESPALRGFLLFGLARQWRHWVCYWVRKLGPAASSRVVSGAMWARWCSSEAEDTMEEQLSFDVPGEVSPAPEFLTIAEAAQRVRCCERTIRRAIDSGALRTGRIHA